MIWLPPISTLFPYTTLFRSTSHSAAFRMERGRRDRLGPTRPRPRGAPVASAVTVIRSAILTDAVQYPYAVTVEPGAPERPGRGLPLGPMTRSEERRVGKACRAGVW